MQHILLRLIIAEDRVANGAAERVKLSGPANRKAGIVCHVSTSVSLTKKILNFSVAFEKKFTEKNAVARILVGVEDTMAVGFPKGMNTQFYYQYTLTLILLKHESSLSLVEGLNGGYARSTNLGVLNLDDVELLPVLSLSK